MICDSIGPHVTVLAALAAAVVAPLLGRTRLKEIGWVLAVVPASVFGYFVSVSDRIWNGEIWRGQLPWAPDLGLNWDLWVSPIGLLLALLVSGIGTLIVLFAGSYFGASPARGRFMSTLFVFMAAMLGLAVTENLLVFFLFWELTSITSYLLIGTTHEKTEARKAALDALLTTAGGGVALLAGILLLGQIAGSYVIGDLIEQHAAIIQHPLYLGAFICVFLGAITKSAQVPFHFWLPGAMAAPAPVSAYLHSATMVKAGVFLLALLHPVLGSTPVWHFSLMGVGALTMTWGALVAVVQTDLKRLLAYTTVSALGTLVMLLGIEDMLAGKAAVIFLIVHALYKGALFMVAGILEKTTGTRDIKQLRGLMRKMPILGIAALFAAASMSGLPPFLGFIAKELIYEVQLESPWVGWPLLICGFVANAANIVVALKVGVAPFLKDTDDPTPLKKLPTVWFRFGPAVLGVSSLVLGIAADGLLSGVVGSILGQAQMSPVEVKIKLWHGFNLVLLLSALTVAAGLVGFAVRERLWWLGNVLRTRCGWNAQAAFRAGLAGFLRGAGAFTLCIQSGNLRNYLIITFLSASGLLVAAFLHTRLDFIMPSRSAFRLEVLLVVLLVAVSAVSLVRARERMTAILLLSCAGFGIATLFALYGAPDLAITQLLVETLTLVLFALAIYGLPLLSEVKESPRNRFLALGIAGIVGGVFTLLTLKALGVALHDPIATELAARSLPEAYGRNVVNVILVDFRALDTLGEITVLVIAALGVAAMLRSADGSVSGGEHRPSSAVLSASARFTSPAMIVFSVYLLLRGHNEPGGGFIGGLVAAMAAILFHLAAPERRLSFLRLTPVVLCGVGLLLAAGSGLPGLLADDSFLAAQWGGEVSLPAVGKVKFGTPLIFDIGVYLVVAGVVLLLYQMLERWHSNRNQLAAT